MRRFVADHLRRDEESLKRTFEGIDRAQLSSACQAMATAPHVAVVGYRSSYPVALHMREQLCGYAETLIFCRIQASP